MGPDAPELDLRQLRDELRQEIRAGDAETRRHLGERIDAVAGDLRTEIRAVEARTGGRIDAVAADLGQEMQAAEDRTRGHAEALARDTRRHFDVIAESLVSKIELVAEGLSGLDQKVESLREDMQDGFAQVDRRFVHLEARIMVLERR